MRRRPGRGTGDGLRNQDDLAAECVRVEQIADGLWSIAMYDPGWRSWIACHLLRRDGSNLLIDSGNPGQGAVLTAALASLGVAPHAVTDLVFTHGHVDHVGGASAFPFARRHIHALDADLAVGRGLTELEHADCPAASAGSLCLGGIALEYQLVGVHTPGSWVLWDRETRALFSGDFLCWFNERLPAVGLVAAELSHLRPRLLRFVDWWTASPRFGSAGEFRAAAGRLAAQFAPALLCAGHGPVLRGEVSSFLGDIAAGAGHGRGSAQG